MKWTVSMSTLSREKVKVVKKTQKKHMKNCKELEKIKNWRKHNKIEGFCFGRDEEYEEEGIVCFYSDYYINKGEKVTAITASNEISDLNLTKFLVEFITDSKSKSIIIFQKKVYKALIKWMRDEKQDWLDIEFIKK